MLLTPSYKLYAVFYIYPMQIIIIALIVLNVIGILYLITRKKPTEQQAQNNSALDVLQAELDKANERLKKATEVELDLTRKLAQKEAELAGVIQQSTNTKREISELQTLFKDQFSNLAQGILDEKSKHMQTQSEQQIKLLLDPLQLNLSEFEKRIQASYSTELQERNSLRDELKRLNENSTKLSEDASNLTQALKADTKAQGNWGELVLERILERSGLTDGVEYKTQHTTSNEHGQVIRPDVIVNLPGEKHLIIDSKVSLTAYNAWVSASTDEERAAQGKAHIASIRSHVKLLSEKNYPSGKGLNAPDFVILFTPIEGAFAMALQQDRELYNDAWDRQIIIVSPTTLLATMRTVSNIWMQERRIRNVQEIAEEGGKLYDKFVAFLVNLEDIGNKLDLARKAYDEAFGKLSTGRGNIIARTQKMQKLGAKTAKQIDVQLLDQAQLDDENE